MKNLLDKIEKEIIGAPLPNEYSVLIKTLIYI